jgi:hypothetical protein
MTEDETFLYDKEYDTAIIGYDGTNYKVTDIKGKDLYKLCNQQLLYAKLCIPIIIISIFIMSGLGGYVIETYGNDNKWLYFISFLCLIGVAIISIWNCGKKFTNSYYTYRLIIDTSLNSDNMLKAREAYFKNKFTLIVNPNFKQV